MLTLDTRLEASITQKIDAEIIKLSEQIVAGLTTFDNYQKHIGHVQGLKAALKMVADARAELLRGRQDQKATQKAPLYET